MLRTNYADTIATVNNDEEDTAVTTRFGHVVKQVRTIKQDVDVTRREVTTMRRIFLGIALFNVGVLLYFLVWYPWT